MHSLLPSLISGLVAIPVVVTARAVIGRRYTDRGQIECAWRGFDKPGKWKHGLVSVSPGRLYFQPRWGSLGTRFARGNEVVLDVHSIDPDEAIRPGLSQAWYVNPRLHILTVHTSDGPVELAMLPKRVERLQVLLRG